jgi:hypothetical protein
MAETADQRLSGFIGWIGHGHRGGSRDICQKERARAKRAHHILSARILCRNVPTASKGMLVGNAERESTSRFAPML